METDYIDYKIVPITFSFIRKNLVQLISIDKSISNSNWREDNFLVPLPGKWEFSYGLIIQNIPVGFIISSIKESNIHIHRFAVAEPYQNHGYGRLLLQALFQKCREDNYRRLTLKVDYSNAKAIKFYKNNGFIILKKINGNYMMQKLLES